MANTFFRFKQFKVEQAQCAMKVTTEACIFGALSAQLSQPHNPNRILDIGTGTGLLALMKAQHTQCAIDAVEINDEAFLQARENFYVSPWKNRLSLFHTDIDHFEPNTTYDLIISNPPFFENHLQGENSAKNQALHTNTLGYHQLAVCINRLLSPKGNAHILLPPQPMQVFEALAKDLGLYTQQKVSIYNRPGSALFREVVSIGRTPINTTKQNFIIREVGNEYSKEFVGLLQPYYLHL
ncbi:methyltransferase [Roseivirga sp. UBA838]|uniref:tRNA1(Val) (adenine(37)-N6)-methyltransferase n=1 Tax=Roseivirga sp. UBA838 TaxID=1947393 RepID=UPI00257F215F|nr:methyltransferase [Roseivirga sp. UBA838]